MKLYIEWLFVNTIVSLTYKNTLIILERFETVWAQKAIQAIYYTFIFMPYLIPFYEI